MLDLIRAQIRLEFMLCWRKPSLVLNPLLFFILVISLFPLGISLDLVVLHKVGAGLIWVSLLLAILLALDRLFQSDFNDGVLDHWLISDIPLVNWVLAKLIAFCIPVILPVLIVIPCLSLMLQLSSGETITLMLSLLLGVPAIVVIAAIAESLSLGVGGRSALLPLLLLPLMIPVLIFGAGAVDVTMLGLDATPLLLFLFAISTISICLGPWVIAFALRLAYV